MTSKWLSDEVMAGLQGLVALRLDSAPALDALPATASVWVRVLISRPIDWDQSQDADRVRVAFRELAATCNRWPTPAQFLSALPKRKLRPALPAPVNGHSAESKRMVAELLRNMRVH